MSALGVIVTLVIICRFLLSKVWEYFFLIVLHTSPENILDKNN